MPEKLTIRQRIIDRIQALVAAKLPIWLTEDLAADRITQAEHDAALADLAEQWDVRGNTQSPFTVVLTAGDQETRPEAMGSPPTDTHTLLIELEAMLTQRQRVADTHARADQVNESSEKVHNRWLGRLASALAEDRHLTESDPTVQLCPLGVRMTYASAPPPETDDELTFFAVLGIEVEHDTYELNLYEGPSIPEKEV